MLKSQHKLFLIIFFFIFHSCSSSGEMELKLGNKNIINKTNTFKVNVFFDKSASIGGYLTRGPKRGEEDDNFKNKTKTFLSYFQDKIFDNTLKIYLIGDNTIERYGEKVKSAGDLVGEFSDGMENNWAFRNGKDTPLHSIFEKILKNISPDPESIGIFVTESIMSYSAEQRKNAQYSNQDIDGLKGDITRVFERYQKDYGVSVYAFLSKFDGTYYNFMNQQESCCLTNLRPFYIWVIGKKDIMPKFTNYIANEKKFKAREELHIGWQYNSPNHQILNSEGRSGNWNWLDSTNIGNLQVGEAIKFTIGLDLKQYPKEVQNEKYLKENLEVDNFIKRETIIVKKQADFFKNISADQTNELKAYTHFITMEINNSAIAEKNVLSVKLKKTMTPWYEKWSTSNDVDINSINNNKKTFAFKELMEGILEAYKQNEYYF